MFFYNESMKKGYCKFKEYREDKDLLQKNVAEYLNLPTTTYATYEQGKAEADYETLIKLSKLYKITINQLLGDNTEIMISISKDQYEKLIEATQLLEETVRLLKIETKKDPEHKP